ncbi:MAG: DUF58 domain-containing protein [Rhodospirillales bacterium]
MTSARHHKTSHDPELESSGNLYGRAEAIGADLPALLVEAHRIAHTVAPGVHGRRRRGSGETFWQFRRYQFGDSVQRIDWRQTAKSDRVYIRETEWEVAQSVWIWRDASPSMEFTSDPNLISKVDRASLLAMALGVLLVRGGERIALAETGRPPSSGSGALMAMADELSHWRDAPPSASAALFARARQLPRHARVVLIGDFLEPVEETHRLLKALAAQRIRGHLLRIVDPAEETLPYDGRVLFDDPEDGHSTLVDWVASSRPAYLSAWRRHGESLRDAARSSGWSIDTHHTDRPPEEALLALYLAVAGITLE